MMNPEATGVGEIPSKPNDNKGIGEGDAWACLKALQAWSTNTVQVGDVNSGASASTTSASHVVSPLATKEAYKETTRDLLYSGVVSNIVTMGTGTKRNAAEVVQQQEPVAIGKRVKVKGSGTNRWDNHNKQTCKCAVCMQCRGELKSSWFKHDQLTCVCAVCMQWRGELKSSWYKHDQLTCVCAVCRQSRGQLRTKDAPLVGATTGGGGGALCGKHSLPAIPAKKGSWLAPYEPSSLECWACSKELSRHNGGGGEAQTFPRFPSRQHPTFPSCGNKVLNTSLAAPPVFPESCCTTTRIPLLWQQKLNYLAELAACSSGHENPSFSSSYLAATPKCAFEAHHERLTCEPTFGISCHAENSDPEQHALQTNCFGNRRCSGWPNSDHTCHASFTGNNSDVVQQCTRDCLNRRRSCGDPASMSYNSRTSLSWQNNFDRREDIAGTSTTLHAGECPHFDTKHLNVPQTHSWELVQERLSAFSAVTKRNGHWNTDPTLENMIKPEPPSEPFLSFGQNTSLFGRDASSTAHVQHDATSHSTLFPEIDNQPVYVPMQSSNSLHHSLSGRTSSVSQFPFGLEVPAQTEHEIYQTVNNFQPPIHAQSFPLTREEDIIDLSSPLCETTSTTSTVNETVNPSPLMDVNSGDMLRSSIMEESLEKLVLQTRVEAGDQARSSDNVVQPTQPAVQKFSKVLVNPEDSHSFVPQKRTKREGSSRVVPKWCQLIQSKPSIIIRKISTVNRSSVAKKSPHSARSEVLEPSSVETKEKGNAGNLAFSCEEKTLEGRPRFQECMTSNCLQSTDFTGVTEFTNVKASRDEIISAKREAVVANIEEDSVSIQNNACSLESPSIKIFFVTGPKVQENPRDTKIRKLDNSRRMPEHLRLQHTPPVDYHDVLPRPVAQRSDNIQDDSEGRGVVPSLSNSVSQDFTQKTQMIDISNSDGKAARTSICAVKDHLEKAIQPAGSLLESTFSKSHLSLQGRKGWGRGEGVCGDGREIRVDSSGHLIPQLEDTYLLLKKHCEAKRHDGAPVGTSSLCTNVGSVFKVGPTRTTNSNRKTVKLSVEVLLPESMRVYYVTRIWKVITPEISIWLTELIKDVESPSTLVSGRSFVPKERTSLVSSTLHDLAKPLDLSLFRKTSGSVASSKAFSRTSFQCSINVEVKETSSEIMIFGTRPRPHEESLTRFWNTQCAESRFILLFPDRLTVSIEDLIKMIEGACSISIAIKKRCFPPLSDCSSNEMDDSAFLLGSTKSQRERMTAFDLPQQSLTGVKSTPLRNIVFPSWVDQPVNDCAIYVFCPGILLRRGLLRLLSSNDAADQYNTPESYCELLSTQSFTGENLENNANVERRQREQICNDYVMLVDHVSVPENTVHPSTQSLTRNEQTSGFPAFYGACTNSTKKNSLRVTCSSSFQDLLKSVVSPAPSRNSECRTDTTDSPEDTSLQTVRASSFEDLKSVASPQLSRNSKFGSHPGEELHQIDSNECSRSIPGLNVWERPSDLRKDDSTSPALTGSSDSVSKPLRRRSRGCPKGGWPKGGCPKGGWPKGGCPKGGWPKGGCPKGGWPKKLQFLATEDLAGHASERFQYKGEAEVDFEVVQSNNLKVSKKPDDFKKKLETFLDSPFHLQELRDLEEHAFLRKPLLRLRETRQRVLHVATKREGMSYLDYHPDLAQKVADAAAPEERLRLLRGFFFWLQHSCTPGSFKPWAATVEEANDSDHDCVEISPEDWGGNNADDVFVEGKTMVGSTGFKCDNTSPRNTRESHLYMRTRGQKRTPASKPANSRCLKEMKPIAEGKIKRESKLRLYLQHYCPDDLSFLPHDDEGDEVMMTLEMFPREIVANDGSVNLILWSKNRHSQSPTVTRHIRAHTQGFGNPRIHT